MKIKVAFKRPRKQLFMNVFAEEQIDEQGNGTNTNGQDGDVNTPPTQQQTEPKPNGTVNFEDLISKARADEKAKLYPQMEKLKADKNDLLLVVAERDKEIAELKKKMTKVTSDFTKLQSESEEGTKTNKTVQEQALTISQLERDFEELQTRYDNDIMALKVSSYREKKIAEAGGAIIPELVTGNTEEEINASVELAKTRYAEIQEKALSNVQMPYSNPASAQLNLFAEKSIDEIARMSPAEYAEYRKNIGLK